MLNQALTAGSSGGVDGALFLIQPDGYKIVPSMRVTQDNVSQQDGSVLHPRWTSGLVATMKVCYALAPLGYVVTSESTPAANELSTPTNVELRIMHEQLILHLQDLLRASADPNNLQRLLWYPTSYGQARMLTGIQTLAWADPVFEVPFTCVTFSLEGPLPYAIDANEMDPTITGGAGPTLLPNAGNAPCYPVVQVNGPFTSFTLSNNDTGEAVVYSGAAVASGHYAEINFFDGTVYLDSSSTDLIASIDPTLTDFWTIAPGGSNVVLSADAPSALVKHWNTYA